MYSRRWSDDLWIPNPSVLPNIYPWMQRYWIMLFSCYITRQIETKWRSLNAMRKNLPKFFPNMAFKVKRFIIPYIINSRTSMTCLSFIIAISWNGCWTSYMEASESKWVNPNDIWYRVNLFWIEGLNLMIFSLIKLIVLLLNIIIPFVV